MRLIADTTTWYLDVADVLLVEIRNPNRFPVAVPGPDWGLDSLPALLRTPKEELRLTDGVGCRWGRRVFTQIPPHGAIHLAYDTRLCTRAARSLLPTMGRLVVSLVAADAFVTDVRDRLHPGTIPVVGVFTAELECSLVGQGEALVGPFRLPPDQAAAKQFLNTIQLRLHDAFLARCYEEFVAKGRDRDRYKRHLAELRERVLAIRPDEIRELEQQIPNCSIVDDVWYRFAIHSLWDPQPAVRRSLLSVLIHERPGSTGAARAEAWLAWPQEWVDPVVADSWGTIVPPGGGAQGCPPVRDRRNPYEVASNSGVDPW